MVTYFADRNGTMLQILLLSPENRVSLCFCVCKYPFLQLCSPQLYSLHREVHSENALYANICIKNVHFTAEVRFYGAYGVCGVRVASVISSGIKYSINKRSSKCFSIFYDDTTVYELLCHGIRVVPSWG